MVLIRHFVIADVRVFAAMNAEADFAPYASLCHCSNCAPEVISSKLYWQVLYIYNAESNALCLVTMDSDAKLA